MCPRVAPDDEVAAPCGRDELGRRKGRRRGARYPVLASIRERRSNPVASAGRARRGPVTFVLLAGPPGLRWADDGRAGDTIELELGPDRNRPPTRVDLDERLSERVIEASIPPLGLLAHPARPERRDRRHLTAVGGAALPRQCPRRRPRARLWHHRRPLRAQVG